MLKVIAPHAEIESAPVQGMDALRVLEKIGRTCYKSEDAITQDSCVAFARGILKRGHESVIEHISFSVRFIVDRGVTHEIVRHRLCSYSQESTRYCNYGAGKFGKEITVIRPPFWTEDSKPYVAWQKAMNTAAQCYLELIESGASAQEARSVLPNSLKTEIVMTANIREWRHFFRMRIARSAHPQMREVTIPLLTAVKTMFPVLFDDIEIPDA